MPVPDVIHVVPIYMPDRAVEGIRTIAELYGKTLKVVIFGQTAKDYVDVPPSGIESLPTYDLVPGDNLSAGLELVTKLTTGKPTLVVMHAAFTETNIAAVVRFVAAAPGRKISILLLPNDWVDAHVNRTLVAMAREPHVGYVPRGYSVTDRARLQTLIEAIRVPARHPARA